MQADALQSTHFRIERGNPSPEELAVVALVLRLVQGAECSGAESVAPPRAAWTLRTVELAGSWASQSRRSWATAV